MKAFEPDGPLVEGANCMLHLVALNFLTLICCIPIVTAGASLTAMHVMCLKMVRNEEGYIAKGFFRAFRENFRQATAVWLMLLAAAAFLAADGYAVSCLDVWFADVAALILPVLAILLCMTAVYLFPMLGRFECTVRQLWMNALKAGLSQFPRTFLIWLLMAAPFVICYYVNVLIPLLFVIAVSGTGYLRACVCNRYFKRLEDAIRNNAVREAASKSV